MTTQESVPDALRDSTVLVTGGAGFVGSHLVDALAPVADVRVLDDLSGGHRTAVHGDATLTVGDVTDEAALAEATDGVDYVFHLAAVSSVPASMDRPTRTLDVNVRATGDLLDHAARNDARVVFASSAAVYGRPSETPIPESERTTPKNPYGVAKLAAERYVRGYADWFDTDTVALRFFNVFGPGQVDGVVPAFVSRARSGSQLVVHGDGDQTRDFVHVEDVVRATFAAATTDATGEAYNVGTGTETSVAELAAIVQDAASNDVDVVHGDPRLADIERSLADASKARDVLGFEATRTVEDGVRALLDADRERRRPEAA